MSERLRVNHVNEFLTFYFHSVLWHLDARPLVSYVVMVATITNAWNVKCFELIIYLFVVVVLFFSIIFKILYYFYYFYSISLSIQYNTSSGHFNQIEWYLFFLFLSFDIVWLMWSSSLTLVECFSYLEFRGQLFYYNFSSSLLILLFLWAFLYVFFLILFFFFFFTLAF